MSLEFRLAIRQLSRRRLAAGVTVFVLASGLALNASLFAILDGVLIKPLPFRDPSRLVMVYGSRQSGAEVLTQSLTAISLRAIREHTDVLESIAAIGPGDLHDGDIEGEGAGIQHRQITPELFDVLGVGPAFGRGLTPGDATLGEPRSVVVGFELWRSRFGQNPAIIGNIATIAGKSVRIIGVMPAGFEFPFGTNVWTALVVPPDRQRFAYLEAVARLQPAVSRDDARDRLRGRTPAGHGTASLYQVRELSEVLKPKHTLTIMLMFTTALIALAIAWIQAAAGELSAATDQARGLAIQICLGASRGLLMRQFASSGAIVAGSALVLALGLTPTVTSVLLRWLPPSATSGHDVAIDFRVLGFAAVASAVGLLAFCMAPAVGLRENRIAELVGGRSTMFGGRPASMRSVFVVAQVALACCLAHLGAIASYSALRLVAADPGFAAAGLHTVRIPSQVIPLREPERLRTAIDAVHEDLASTPNLTSSVAFADTSPFGPGGFFRSVQLAEDRAATPLLVKTSSVSDNYFRTTRIPILEGRAFVKEDAAVSAAMVNERLADTLRHGQSLVGSEIALGGLRHRVIGVVGNIHDESPSLPPRPMVYTLADRGTAERILLVRTNSGHTEKALAALRRSLELRTGSDWQAFNVRHAEEALFRSTALFRTRSVLLSFLSAVVVALTSVGIFTAVSHLVQTRQHEIGIRLALGADPAGIRYWLVGRIMMLVSAGIAIGIAAGVTLAHFSRSLLFEVAPFDPTSIAGVVLLFTSVAVGSAALPAFRASRFDPVRMLRES